MLLRNQAKRLITINSMAGGTLESFKVLPGHNPAVEVPDKHCKSDFVKNLIATGDLRVMPSEASEEALDSDEETEDALRAQLADLGVEADGRWGVKRLQEEIEKALAK